MIFRFALEPEGISDWRDLRYINDGLGVEHARILALVPDQWRAEALRMVEACASESERHYLTSILEDLLLDQSKWVETGTTGTAKNTWRELARSYAHNLRGIIVAHDPEAEPEIAVADLHQPASPWNVAREGEVTRDAGSISNLMVPLLAISRTAHLFDPYFSPNRPRHLTVLSRTLQRCSEERALPLRFTVHSALNHARNQEKLEQPEDWEQACRDLLPDHVPQGYTLEVIRWAQVKGGPRPHERFLTTDRGGLALDYGFDEGRPDQPGTTTYRLLTRSAAAKRLARIDPEDPNHANHRVYDMDSRVEITGNPAVTR